MNLHLPTGGLAGAACGALIAGPWGGVGVPSNVPEPSFSRKKLGLSGPVSIRRVL